jgi:hypothetical protein
MPSERDTLRERLKKQGPLEAIFELFKTAWERWIWPAIGMVAAPTWAGVVAVATGILAWFSRLDPLAVWTLSLLALGGGLWIASQLRSWAAGHSDTPPKVHEQPLATNEPSVEFTLPGSWAELGFRYRRLGVEGQYELAAEEIYLRIRAKQNMQNVLIEIAARQNRPDVLEPVAKIGSSEFVGAVTKGREQSFQIMQRTYWNVPASFADPSTGQQASRSIRVEKEVRFFPENPQHFVGQLGHLYYFSVTVHHDHDDGPDRAEFAIDVPKRREGPQSVLRALKNIKAIDK